MLAALNCSLIHFSKLKCYGNIAYITQSVHSSTHLKHVHVIFSDIQQTTHDCGNIKTFNLQIFKISMKVSVR
jgi:hypothetical protein